MTAPSNDVVRYKKLAPCPCCKRLTTTQDELARTMRNEFSRGSTYQTDLDFLAYGTEVVTDAGSTHKIPFLWGFETKISSCPTWAHQSETLCLFNQVIRNRAKYGKHEKRGEHLIGHSPIRGFKSEHGAASIRMRGWHTWRLRGKTPEDSSKMWWCGFGDEPAAEVTAEQILGMLRHKIDPDSLQPLDMTTRTTGTWRKNDLPLLAGVGAEFEQVFQDERLTDDGTVPVDCEHCGTRFTIVEPWRKWLADRGHHSQGRCLVVHRYGWEDVEDSPMKPLLKESRKNCLMVVCLRDRPDRPMTVRETVILKALGSAMGNRDLRRPNDPEQIASALSTFKSNRNGAARGYVPLLLCGAHQLDYWSRDRIEWDGVPVSLRTLEDLMLFRLDPRGLEGIRKRRAAEVNHDQKEEEKQVHG